MWERWRRGESLKAIGRELEKEGSCIYYQLASYGGIRPQPRCRSRRVLNLSEREEISRGIVAEQSIRSIASALGRSASAVSREIQRNRGYDERLRTIELRIAWIPCYRDSVIRSFGDAGTEDIFNGRKTKRARRSCPGSVWKVARRKLELLDSASTLGDLRVPPGNQLEALKEDRLGQHSIRVNDQYRVCFVWTETGPAEVEIVDYH